MPAATLIYHSKRAYDDGAILEIKLWRLPPGRTVPGSTHPFKYSLFYGRDGQQVLGFDNESGKGDHMHLSGVEGRYPFTTVEQLTLDFLRGVAELRGDRL